jgi:sarcosine oxidase subunit beta
VTRTADVVVAGAGLNGAATAYFLHRQGFRRIVVVDAAVPGVAGASGASVGLLRTHYDNRPETELAARSMPYFRNWEEVTGEPCDWSQTGFLRFVETHELAKMEQNVAVQREFGETIEILSPAEVHKRFPQFRADDIGAAVFEPGSGTASNSKATLTLLARTAADGVAVEANCRVLRLETEAGRIAGVVTERERIATPLVVLAAGVASRQLAATCGVEVPLVAKAIRVADIAAPSDVHMPITYMDPISDSWLTLRKGGRALISAINPAHGAAIDPERYDADFPKADAEAGLRPVSARLPGIERATIRAWWMRPDCYAPDGKPILGGVEEMSGLFLNTAGAGKGHKVAPAAGRALAELIAEGRSATADISRFRLSRFQEEARPWSDSEYGKRVIG